MGQFGFSTSYIPGPGQHDETPLKELVKVLYNHPNLDGVTIGQMTAVRRLYLEVSFGTQLNERIYFIISFSQLKAQLKNILLFAKTSVALHDAGHV